MPSLHSPPFVITSVITLCVHRWQTEQCGATQFSAFAAVASTPLFCHPGSSIVPLYPLFIVLLLFDEMVFTLFILMNFESSWWRRSVLGAWWNLKFKVVGLSLSPGLIDLGFRLVEWIWVYLMLNSIKGFILGQNQRGTFIWMKYMI